jgi:hypothetical protein
MSGHCARHDNTVISETDKKVLDLSNGHILKDGPYN